MYPETRQASQLVCANERGYTLYVYVTPTQPILRRGRMKIEKVLQKSWMESILGLLFMGTYLYIMRLL